MPADSDKNQDDYAALNELIVNCPDFERLEGLLGGFNVFQVLKFEHGEIRHSNMLAWVLNPNESHGLGADFLKKWLMRVIHEASSDGEVPIAAVDIDGWQILSAEVRREWKNIDLLVVLRFVGGEEWVLCIENKVLARQSPNQLKNYRSRVEQEFEHCSKKIYLFLTKEAETPDDAAYLPASYSQVHQALKESMASRSHTLGAEPKVLLENYLRLLEEKFMDESEIARTAARIYQQHRRAIDVILEHRPDNLKVLSDRVRQLLMANGESLDIVMDSASKAYIRFLPKAWDLPGNRLGSAWSGSQRTILFELSLTPARARLYIIAGKAPDPWIDPLWELSSRRPFERSNWRTRPRIWVSVHTFPAETLRLEDCTTEEADERAQYVVDKIMGWLNQKNTKEIIDIITERIPDLETIMGLQRSEPTAVHSEELTEPHHA